jgi:hypothetical protein
MPRRFTAQAARKSLKFAEYTRLVAMLVATREAEARQQALAKKLEKPQSLVAKYEGSERRIDLAEFIAIVGESRRLIVTRLFPRPNREAPSSVRSLPDLYRPKYGRPHDQPAR